MAAGAPARRAPADRPRRTAEAAARAHEEALRTRREQAWQSGEHRTWARLTWDDIGRFFIGVARSGLKGLSLLFAAVGTQHPTDVVAEVPLDLQDEAAETCGWIVCLIAEQLLGVGIEAP